MIEEIKFKITEIKEKLEKLKTDHDYVFGDFNRSTDKIRQIRNDSLIAYADFKKKSAELSHEGEIYAIENDYQDKDTEITKQIVKFIAFKYSILKNEFPEIAQYFEQSSSELNFYQNINQYQSNNSPHFNLQRVNLSESELGELLEKDNAEWVIQNGRLTNGNVEISNGTNVNLKYNASNMYSGIIQIDSTNRITFNTEGGKSIYIPLVSLNIGIVVIEKQ
ncbi:hypothetical protein GPJ56_007074 [Histomonas meleagridis]|uniref:uncharacterized protein n=1 Tax=Histomonas meleagridis TaxID=135588 RepID=UPI00355AA08B|nr:hypothetical protein GPJ56_007074 [Histomonas meleagridis]KAH0799787.1 hypothetical protein GO595_007508 [Histomonas meleagridis]